MKKLLHFRKTGLLILFLALFSVVSYACDYTIVLYDDYGDGWNGGTVTVYVNGTAVPALTDITETGAGPTTFTISGVATGDLITTTYTAGSWAYENEYYIYDAIGAEVASDGTGGATPTGISTGIAVTCPYQLDAGITNINTANCPGNNNIYAELNNFGIDTLFSVTIAWTIDGVPQTPINWSDTLLIPNSTLILLGSHLFTFGSSYTIEAWTESPNAGVDGNLANDTNLLNLNFTNILNLPWFDDLESEPIGFNQTLANNWTISTTSNPKWEIENSTGSNENSTGTGPFYDHTYEGVAGGIYAYLETSGGSLDSTSYLTSPCIDISSYSNPTLEFWYHMYGASMGILQVEQLINGVWVPVLNLNGQQQAAGNSPWLKTSISLDSTATQIRFAGIRGTSYTSDMSIDDVKIYELMANDLKAETWITPVNGDTVNPAMNITVQVKNIGFEEQSDFNMMYSIDNGTTWVSELYTDTIQPDSLLSYTFTSTANMALPGFYSCYGVVKNLGDTMISNDTVFENLYICSPLTGIYTIGPDPGDDFATFDDVAMVLNSCGISGTVDFLIDSGTYYGHMDLFSINGSNSTNTITFNGGDAALVSLIDTVNNAIISLSGTDYITFKNMSFENTKTTNAWGIKLMDTAEYVTIDSCAFNMYYASGVVDVVAINTGSSMTSNSLEENSANFLTISNNTITGGEYGIHLEGLPTAGSYMREIEISGNTIHNIDDYGIYFDNADSITIANNTIYDVYAASADGIYLEDIVNFYISGNNIIAPDYAIIVFDGNYSTDGVTPGSVVSFITNNMLISTGDDALRLDDFEEANVFHNTCYGYVAAGIHLNDLVNVDIRNNIFVSDNYYAFYSLDPITTPLDYNIYYVSDTSINLAYETTAQVDLAAWQIYNATANANSVAADPIFFSTNDLHIYSPFTDDLGDNTVGVLIDIDGDTRPMGTNVDIGADEYTASTDDLILLSILNPISGDMGCSVVNDSIIAEIYNLGLDTVDFAATPVTVTANISGNNINTYQTTINTGTLAFDDTLVVTITNTLNLPNGGTSQIDVYLDFVPDMNNLNDTASTPVVIHTSSPNITLSADSICFGDSTQISSVFTLFGTGTYLTPFVKVTYDTLNSSLPPALDTISISGLSTHASDIIFLQIDSIRHTWNSDINIVLYAPDGSSIDVSSNNGSNGDGYYGVIFSDTAATAITTAPTAPITGSYSPEQPLSSLTGSANGDWVLEITDDAGGDNGALLGWTIVLPSNNGIVTIAWTPSTGLSDTTIANPMASPTVTTTYQISIIDSIGCTNTDSITITVNPNPVVSLGANTAICDTTTLLLDAGNPGASYLWQDNATSQTYLVDGSVVGVGSHDFSVIVTNTYGCEGGDTITVDITACSGINDPEAQLLIYPNPTSDYFTIDFGMLEHGTYFVEMFNMNGQIVIAREVEYSGNTVTIDVNNTPSGIYSIRVIGQNDTFTGTLRVE